MGPSRENYPPQWQWRFDFARRKLAAGLGRLSRRVIAPPLGDPHYVSFDYPESNPKFAADFAALAIVWTKLELVDARLNDGYAFVEEYDSTCGARRRFHTEDDLVLMRRPARLRRDIG